MNPENSASPSHSWLFNRIYQAVILFFRLILTIFFRTILCIQSPLATEQKCFQEGFPAILAIGLHANQFVDPLIVILNSMRKISMLMAKTSTERKFVNFFARILEAIPVSRRMDYKRKGSGFISIDNREIEKMRNSNESDFPVHLNGFHTSYGRTYGRRSCKYPRYDNWSR